MILNSFNAHNMQASAHPKYTSITKMLQNTIGKKQQQETSPNSVL